MRQLVVLLLVAGCAEAPALEQSSAELDADNGTSLNGVRLNGTSLNGVRLNGTSLNGTRLNGVRLNGSGLDGALLTGSTTGTPPTSGADAIGSMWAGVTSQGETIALRIDGATAGAGDAADLWFYDVSYQTEEGWQPLCGVDDAGAPVHAVAVAGTWRPAGLDLAHYAADGDEFTWACRGRSIAKCVEMGYRPWTHVDHLQACVRLLRGDFCGTGVPLTVDGTLVNLYDDLGVQRDTEHWKVEAAWGPGGPVCVDKNNAARYYRVLGSQPSCVQVVLDKKCGKSFPPGAYLISELP